MAREEEIAAIAKDPSASIPISDTYNIRIKSDLFLESLPELSAVPCLARPCLDQAGGNDEKYVRNLKEKKRE